jgi:hypothetical protein
MVSKRSVYAEADKDLRAARLEVNVAATFVVAVIDQVVDEVLGSIGVGDDPVNLAFGLLENDLRDDSPAFHIDAEESICDGVVPLNIKGVDDVADVISANKKGFRLGPRDGCTGGVQRPVKHLRKSEGERCALYAFCGHPAYKF